MSLLSVSMESAELRNRADLGFVETKEYPHRHWKSWLLIVALIVVVAVLLQNFKFSDLWIDNDASISSEILEASEFKRSEVSSINLRDVGDLASAKFESGDVNNPEQSKSTELDASNKLIAIDSNRPSNLEPTTVSESASSYQPETYTSIDDALHSASQFIQMQRLTRPSSGNAYDAIVWVLDKAPNNLNAQQLLLDLQSQYRNLIAASNSEAQAQQYSQRLRLIELAHTDILQLSEALEFKNPESISSKPNVNSNEMRISIESASELTVAQVMSELATLNANKQHGKAIELLENQIATAHPNSTVLKAALIDQEFLAQNVSALMALSHDSHIESAKYAQARSLQLQYGASRAKEYLASLPLVQLSSASQLLLAGLQRENEEFELAFASYQRLLRLDQNNGQAWLGYAVTAESLGEFQLALYAYRKVLIASSVGASFGPEINAFVKSRVIDLASRVSVDAEGESSW